MIIFDQNLYYFLSHLAALVSCGVSRSTVRFKTASWRNVDEQQAVFPDTRLRANVSVVKLVDQLLICCFRETRSRLEMLGLRLVG